MDATNTIWKSYDDDDYRPTIAEMAFIANIAPSKRLENWLARRVVRLKAEIFGSRWRRFWWDDSAQLAFINELVRFGITIEVANRLVASLSKNKDLTIYSPHHGRSPFCGLFQLADLDPSEREDYLNKLAERAWMITCESDQTGQIYRETIVSWKRCEHDQVDIVQVPADSCIIIKFAPIIEGVLKRWIQILERRMEEKAS